MTVLEELADSPVLTIPLPRFTEFKSKDDTKYAVSESDDDEILDSFVTSSFNRITLENITGVVDKLVKLSFKIRNPAIRLGFSTATSYKEIDPDTGVDLIQEFSSADHRHVAEFFANCRRLRGASSVSHIDEFLIQRLGKANTVRRQQFRKWRRHRIKLETTEKPKPQPNIVQALHDIDLAGSNPAQNGAQSIPTTATQAINIVPEFDDVASHISVSTEAPFKHFEGHEIIFPQLPETLTSQKEFECPFCCILCSGTCSTGMRWR